MCPRAAEETARAERGRTLVQPAVARVDHHVGRLALGCPQLVLDGRIGGAWAETLELSDPAIYESVRLPLTQAVILGKSGHRRTP